MKLVHYLSLLVLLILGIIAHAMVTKDTTASSNSLSFFPTIGKQATPELELINQFGGTGNALDVQGEYIYTNLGSRLVVLDKSDLSQIGEFFITYGSPQAIDVVGNDAYLATSNELLIVDISNPANPVAKGYLKYADDFSALEIADMVVRDNYAFILSKNTHDQALYIVDVSDVNKPNFTARHGIYWALGGIVLNGDFAYITSETGLQIVDISTPTQPVDAGCYACDYQNFYLPMTDIEIQNDLLYISYSDDINEQIGLKILDIQTPTAPTEIGSIDLAREKYSRSSLAINNNYAYLNANETFMVIDISNPNEPSQVGDFDGGFGDGNPAKMVANSDSVYVLDFFLGLHKIDVTIPSQPDSTHKYDQFWWWRIGSVAKSGNYLFISTYYEVYIVQLETPHTPVEIGTLGIPASDLEIEGQYLYITNGTGLHIYNILQPESPLEVGFLDLPSSGLQVSGNKVYLTQGSDKFWIVDASVKNNPTQVGSYHAPPFINDFVVDGNYAYLAENDDVYGGGVIIVDISNPFSPTYVNEYSTGTGIYSIAKIDDFIFLPDLLNKLSVLNVSNPQSPVLAATYPGLTAPVSSAENRAYLRDTSESTIWLYDTANLPQMLPLAHRKGPIGNIYVDDYVYVVGSNGIFILDSPFNN